MAVLYVPFGNGCKIGVGFEERLWRVRRRDGGRDGRLWGSRIWIYDEQRVGNRGVSEVPRWRCNGRQGFLGSRLELRREGVDEK